MNYEPLTLFLFFKIADFITSDIIEIASLRSTSKLE